MTTAAHPRLWRQTGVKPPLLKVSPPSAGQPSSPGGSATGVGVQGHEWEGSEWPGRTQCPDAPQSEFNTAGCPNKTPQYALRTLTMPDVTAVNVTWTGGKDKARKPQRKGQAHNQGVHSVGRRERASPPWSCTRTEFLGGAHTRGDDPREHNDK